VTRSGRGRASARAERGATERGATLNPIGFVDLSMGSCYDRVWTIFETLETQYGLTKVEGNVTRTLESARVLQHWRP